MSKKYNWENMKELEVSISKKCALSLSEHLHSRYIPENPMSLKQLNCFK